MEITGEFSLVDDGAVVDSGNFSSLGFRDTNPGAVAAFFGAAKCEKRMTIVIVNTPVGSEDWPAVEEVAQSGRVYLYGGWIDGFQLPKQTRPLSKVHYVDTAVKSGKVKVDKDLFLNTDIVFYNQRGAGKQRFRQPSQCYFNTPSNVCGTCEEHWYGLSAERRSDDSVAVYSVGQ